MTRAHLQASLLLNLQLIETLYPKAPQVELQTVREFLLAQGSLEALEKTQRALGYTPRQSLRFKEQSTGVTQLRFLVNHSNGSEFLDHLNSKARSSNKAIFRQADKLPRGATSPRPPRPTHPPPSTSHATKARWIPSEVNVPFATLKGRAKAKRKAPKSKLGPAMKRSTRTNSDPRPLPPRHW